MRIKSISPFILALVLTTVILSCKKDRTPSNEEIELAIDIQKNNAEATKVYDLVTDEINDLTATVDSMNYASASKGLDSCVTISINHPDTTTWPKSIVVDYSGNCTNQNGNILSGQITITQTERYRTQGMVRTINFNGFRINGYLIGGTKTITNTGTVNGFKTFSVSIANGSVTTPDGEVIVTRSAQRTRTWIEGENTAVRFDDVYLITGNTSGTTRNGKEFSATITQPLKVARNCRWIEQGEITTTIVDGPTVVVNFGNGTCDQMATVTVNGNTRTITLRN